MRLIRVNSSFFGAYKDKNALRKKVKDWLRLHFLGFAIYNQNFGAFIEFNSESVNKLTFGRSNDLLVKRLKCLSSLKEIVANGEHLKSEKSVKKNYDKAHHFKVKLNFDNEIIEYRFVVLQSFNERKFMYAGVLE